MKINRADLFDGSTVPAGLRRSFINDTDDSCEKKGQTKGNDKASFQRSFSLKHLHFTAGFFSKRTLRGHR